MASTTINMAETCPTYTKSSNKRNKNNHIMLNIILFGPPGAGKGTQSRYICEKYNLTYISTGEMLREEIANKTEIGKQVEDIINKGHLVSDEIVEEIIEERMEAHPDAVGFLFDGYPRTIKQAEDLEVILPKHNTEIAGVLSLEVPEDILIQRMLDRGKTEGRADDNIDTIKRRFMEYHEKTKPLLDFYKNKGLLHEINGVGNIEEISKELCETIENLKR